MSDTVAPAGQVYQLRVVLAGISPLIWRRPLVAGTTTLAGLHMVLQTSFGWSDEHLHRFIVHGVEYALPRDGAGWHRDARTVSLAGFGLRQGERFVYEYDFYDAWRHDIRVEQITATVPGQHYPVCAGGARTAPPEGCGGAWAFLALRRQNNVVAVTARLAELLAPLMDAPGDALVESCWATTARNWQSWRGGRASTTSTVPGSTGLWPAWRSDLGEETS